MRRIVATILAIMILVLNLGLSIHLHVCMGNVVGIAFAQQDEDAPCGGCGMKKQSEKNGCCEDVQKVVKTDEGSLLQSKIFANNDLIKDFVLPSVLHDIVRPCMVLQKAIAFNSHIFVPPDVISKLPLYISFLSLLI